MVRADVDSVFQDTATSLGMGDVLPPKRQTVVDRLRKRFELYRRHQNSCLPRYEQSVNALYEKERQDTLLLKQRYLESKAKKAKNKSDHHRTSSVARESSLDSQKLTSHAKPIKRAPEGSPAIASSENPKDETERPTKIKQSENLPDVGNAEQQQQHQHLPSQQQPQQTPTTLNFSVQVVQQFTNCNNSTQQSLQQTVQTNVTFDGSASADAVQVGGQSAGGTGHPPQQQQQQTTTSTTSSTATSATSAQTDKGVPPQEEALSASVIGSQDCKQEDEKQSNLCQFKNQAATDSNSGDRFSDTFPSLAFAEDSGEDVIHPDILKDLIDDVFTNSADIMKDFDFEDSVGSLKGNEKDEISDLVKDIKQTAEATELQQAFRNTESLLFSHSINQQSQHQHPHLGNLFDGSSASSSVASTLPVMTLASTTTPVLPYVQQQQQQQQQRMIPYPGRNMATATATALGLDFKLTEPSPAALTLKQMAEQHQNMQKQQQHLGQSIGTSAGPNALRSQFDLDNLTNPMSSFRTRFLGVAGPGQKPQNVFSNVGYDPAFPGVVPISVDAGGGGGAAVDIFKQGRCAVGSRPMSDREKQQQQHFLQTPVASGGVDKKPVVYGTAAGRINYYQDVSMVPGGSNFHVSGGRFVGGVQSDGRQQQICERLQPVVSGNNRVVQQQQILNVSQNVIRPQENLHQQYPNMYSCGQQQGNGNMYNVLLQHNPFPSSQFQSQAGASRITADYKQNVMASNNHMVMAMDQLSCPTTYSNSFVTQQRFPPSNQWRNVQQTHLPQDSSSLSPSVDVFQQHQTAYASLNDSSGGVLPGAQQQQHGLLHHPYKTVGAQMTSSARGPRPNLMSPNSSSMMQQQQSVQSRPSVHVLGPVDGQTLVQEVAAVAARLTPTTPVFGVHQDMVGRQDGSQINLDFLDHIDSSTASDLLNFDQVMQNAGNHFPLLDDMDMLGK